MGVQDMSEYWDQDGEVLSEADLRERYDEMLDEVYEPFQLGNGVEYYPSDILKNCDPTAYRCGFVDWLSAEIEDGIFGEEDPTKDDGERD